MIPFEKKDIQMEGEFREPREKNTLRQVKALIYKNWLIKRRERCGICSEFTLPILFVIGIYVLIAYLQCSDIFYPTDKDKEDCREQISMIKISALPALIGLLFPQLATIGSRFLIQTMVEEKQNKVKDSLKLMSISYFSQSVSFMIFQAVFAVIGSIIVSAPFIGNTSFFTPGNELLTGIKDLENDGRKDAVAKGIQLLIVVLLNYIVNIPASMAISTLFQDYRVAQQIGGLFLFLPVLIVLKLLTNPDSDAIYAVYPVSILPTAPVTIALISICTPQYTVKTRFPVNIIFDVSKISIGAMWAFLVLNIPFWYLIYLYLDQVMPNDYGIQKHPCFCLQSSRNKKKSQNIEQENHMADYLKSKEDDNELGNQNDFEENIYNPKDAILITNLTKQFGKLNAVNNIKFSIKEGEVMTILGHNGAGKTTLINMLTGMFKSTSGDVTVYGNSILTDIDTIQQNLGLCQQFDILYDLMNCEEHLELVCEAKNIPKNEIPLLVSETLNLVMLTEHKEKLINELSGGMKRKLSLAMAIVSKPQLLILDEPTSGLDVESRQHIWQLIKQIKKECSIIMSSQHLEEADHLADRICIMTKGQLLALDTPHQIKKRFGVGFKLLIEPKTNVINLQEFEKLKFESIDPVVLNEETIPYGLKESRDSTQRKLIYLIPFSETEILTKVLKALQDNETTNKAYVDIEMNSLEDAYVKIAEEEESLLADLSKKRAQYGSQKRQIEMTPIPLKSVEVEIFQNDEKTKAHQHESSDSDEISRYKQVKLEQNFLREVAAHYWRRILMFSATSQELYQLSGPFFLMLQWLLLVDIILTAVLQLIPISEETEQRIRNGVNTGVYPTLIILGVLITSGLFAVTLVKDRNDGCRYLMKISGVRSSAYILGISLADSALLIIPISFLVLFALILKIEVFFKYGGLIYLSFIAFSLPFVHTLNLFGFMFKSHETAFKYMVGPALATFIGSTIIRIYADRFGGANASTTLDYIVCYLSFNKAFEILLRPNQSDRSLRAIIPYIIAMLIQAFVLYLICVLCDYNINNNHKGSDGEKQTRERTQLPEGVDVIMHREQAQKVWNSSPIEPKPKENSVADLHQSNEGGNVIFENTPVYIQANQLKKVYKGFAAINENTFYVKKGEVFGLLGPNGAGKSTTFNVLSMAIQRTDGGVKLMNKNLDSLNLSSDKVPMGMVPQHNTIWDMLTVDQSLKYICHIRGVPLSEVDFQISYIKKTLDLDPFATTKACQLSGGNKRKLLCAMSLVGYPKIEFLDEPTTGVDPVSCRSLFKMLKSLDESSMILTTHRMDEAESLCDNCVIMINGRFACYGSPGQLKATYGKGYSVWLTSQDKIEEIKTFIDQNLPQMKFISVIDQVDNESTHLSTWQIEEKISSLENGLAQVAQILHKMKMQQLVQNFGLNRASLDQIFVQFAQNQEIDQQNE